MMLWSVIVLFIVSAFIVVLLILVFIIYGMYLTQKNKVETRIAEERIRLEKNRMENAPGTWSDMRKLRHDMKQHLTMIDAYLDSGDIDECKEYLKKLMPEVSKFGKTYASDNKVIDYIVGAKLTDLNGVDTVVSGSIGSLADINSADLACVLGNVIDNALEAVEKARDKRIELFFIQQNSNRVIICKNTVKRSVLARNRDLVTTKKHKGRHGFGTKIVKETVEKYDGTVEYFEDDGMFGVQLVFPAPKENQKVPAV